MIPKKYNLTILASGYIGFLILLFAVLGYEKTEPASQTDSFSSRSNTASQNRQSKNTDPVSAPSSAMEIKGKVVGVSDGDTITVLDKNKKQYKIRLQGIDSPESGRALG